MHVFTFSYIKIYCHLHFNLLISTYNTFLPLNSTFLLMVIFMISNYCTKYIRLQCTHVMLSIGGHVRCAPLFWLYGQVPSVGRCLIATKVTKLFHCIIVIFCASTVVVVIVDTVDDAVSVAAGSLKGPLTIGVHHLPANIIVELAIILIIDSTKCNNYLIFVDR